MRVGIDSYAYHRLLGEVRPGEQQPPRAAFARGYEDVLAEAQRLGVDVLSLETNVLPPPAETDVGALRDAARPVDLVLAHGHPQGLRFGRDAQQAADLRGWIEGAAAAGLPLVRLVVGGPWARQDEPEGVVGRTVAALAPPVELAASLGVDLALENHADLTLDEVETVLELLGAPHLGVCFDTSNWVRVGDDPVEAAGRLAGRVRLVHLKDHVARADDGLTGPRSVALGSGEVDLEGVLDALLAADPNVPVCVELGHLGAGSDEVDIVERGVAWLRAEATRREAVAKGG